MITVVSEEEKKKAMIQFGLLFYQAIRFKISFSYWNITSGNEILKKVQSSGNMLIAAIILSAF